MQKMGAAWVMEMELVSIERAALGRCLLPGSLRTDQCLAFQLTFIFSMVVKSRGCGIKMTSLLLILVPFLSAN